MGGYMLFAIGLLLDYYSIDFGATLAAGIAHNGEATDWSGSQNSPLDNIHCTCVYLQKHLFLLQLARQSGPQTFPPGIPLFDVV